MSERIRVRLFAEYGRDWPLWFPADRPEYDDEGMGLLSGDLVQRAVDWAADFGALEPGLAWPSEVARLQHLLEGYRLARLVQEELGPGFDVVATHDHFGDPWAGLTD
ncbi:hypothetical protein [Luteococcus peritonei]|uniref:Uncharacterized protein n=1 Tax=Luteococcus peritonei TaxID=88874 RepID=A0ABW4RXW1_9ACTN